MLTRLTPRRPVERGTARILIALAGLVSLPAHAQTAERGGSVLAVRSGAPVNIYIPPQVAGRKTSPLVVLLHGSGGDGLRALRASNLKATADKHGFVIVMPDGGTRLPNGFAWNIPGVPNTSGKLPSAADRDDVAYLNAVFDALIESGIADPGRVYVTGISGGGRMASWLGCVASLRIAAIAPVVGLRAGNPSRSDPSRPDPETCKPARPMPVLAFAGDRDPVNPVAGGGAPYWQYSMHAAETRWAALNGCDPASTITHLPGDIDEVRYQGCRAGAAIVSRTTKGGRHRWLADNEVMWTFFAAHRRDKAE